MGIQITASDIMRTPAESIQSDESLREAAFRLVQTSLDTLIVRAGDEIIGFISESDLITALAHRESVQCNVAEFATALDIRIDHDEPLAKVASRFDSVDVSHFPVVDENELVGMIATRDVAEYFETPVTDRSSLQSPPSDTNRIVPTTTYDLSDWQCRCWCHENAALSVGDTVEFSKHVSMEDVVDFALATGETDRKHLDPALREQSGFEGHEVSSAFAGALVDATIARLPSVLYPISRTFRHHHGIAADTRISAVCRVTDQLGEQKYRIEASVGPEDERPAVDAEVTAVAVPLSRAVDEPNDQMYSDESPHFG